MRLPLSKAASLLVEKTEREAAPLYRRAQELMSETLRAILTDNDRDVATAMRATIERDASGKPAAIVLPDEETAEEAE